MELRKAAGNTYYIAGPTNTGLFLFRDKYTLIIDTGEGRQQARQICETIAQQGWQIKFVFNTHEHPDHCGGNPYIKEHYPGAIFYSSPGARVFIENDYLAPLYLYGGNPPDELARHYIRKNKLQVDMLTEAGIARINDEKFTILSLSGHAHGQVGIATRDRVCFLGDALFSPEIIAKYSFPFLFDIHKQFETLTAIAELDYEYYVLGHAPEHYDYQHLQQIVKDNRSNLDSCLNLILDLLDQPKSREALLEEIAILNDLEIDFEEHFYLLSTVGAMLTYLSRDGIIDKQLENGRLYYFRS